MDWRKIVVPVLCIGLLYAGWQTGGWRGLAFVASGLVMFVLVHFSRVMGVLNRASQNPKGHVGSAVMLNAKLKRGVNLLHVMAMTRSIGEPLSAEGADPELFRWTDDSGSSVTCEFVHGRLAKWTLVRPDTPAP
jgi:hypothetical protein